MKQAIVARADLGMGEGKLAAQVAHASLQAYEEADARTQREWKGSGQKKIVLQAPTGRKPTDSRTRSSATRATPSSNPAPSRRWPSALRRTSTSTLLPANCNSTESDRTGNNRGRENR